jgi:Gpi18-like mannosyltransferase
MKLQISEKANKDNSLVLLLIAAVLMIKIIFIIAAAIYNKTLPNSWDAVTAIFNRNDSWWYEQIARNGYKDYLLIDYGEQKVPFKQDVQSTWAFFPLYPSLCALLMQAFGWSFNTSAFVWSIILSSAVAVLLFKVAKRHFKERQKALWASFLYLLFPFNLHLYMYYTEALFLLGILGTIHGLQDKKIWWTIFGTSIIVLTRPNGLMMLLPLWIFALEQSRKHCFPQKSRLVNTLLFVPSGLFFLGYLYYQYTQTGYYNAFVLAGAAWDRKMQFPFLTLFTQSSGIGKVLSVYTLGVIVYAGIKWRKLPLSLNLLIWLNLLLPLSMGGVTSMPRFISMLFPLYFLLAEDLERFKSKKMIAALCFMGQLFVLYFWNISYGLGY